MKFSEIPYKRVSLEEAGGDFDKAIAMMENADTAEQAIAAVDEFDRVTREVETAVNIVYVRHTLNTEDPFYEAEQDYYDETTPQFKEYVFRFNKAMLGSPHREAIEREYNPLLTLNAEIAMKAFSPEIIPDKQEENKLISDYVKLMSTAKVTFDGKEMTRSALGFYKEHKDRATRIAAYEADAVFLNAHKDELDDIFDKLVKVRDRMGRKLGYDNFIQLGYYTAGEMGRNCYGQREVADFRELVRASLVPITTRLKQAQAKRLGLDRLHFYDDFVIFPDGNAVPKGTPEEIFENGRKMFAELSPETDEFFNFMLEHELFDVLTKPGKSGGGYCTYFPNQHMPFIFANFNGTTGDIDVLTHEGGHAFAEYQNRDCRLIEQILPTMEGAEVHSMSMELFTWPWMEKFFDDAKKYRYGHLAGAFSFIPYGCIVDEFQHIVYANPGMTPAERNSAYLELEAKYRPYLDLSDTPFFNEGRRWQVQSHIYEVPFYYIDYCLAQTVALHLWSLSRQDYKAAWQKYAKFVSFGGTKTFTELLAAADIPSPFTRETFDSVVAAAVEYLDKE